MRQESIFPGQPWLDTNGNAIQAHGGAVYYEDGVYYWYGENKEHTDGANQGLFVPRFVQLAGRGIPCGARCG